MGDRQGERAGARAPRAFRLPSAPPFTDRSTTVLPERLALTRDAYRAPAKPVEFRCAPSPRSA